MSGPFVNERPGGFDATFSKHSYGLLRPRRSAHDPVMAAKRYVQGGRRFVVDVDLEKSFDRRQGP